MPNSISGSTPVTRTRRDGADVQAALEKVVYHLVACRVVALEELGARLHGRHARGQSPRPPTYHMAISAR